MTCVHFWVLNAHNLGVCKKCQSVKEFSGQGSSGLNTDWHRNNAVSQHAPKGK